MKNRKLLIGLGVGGALLVCCILAGLFGRGAGPSPAPTAPALTETPLAATPTPVPLTPTPIIWILEAPEGFTHGLFTKDALMDESCLDCILGDLVGGTKLAPAEEGCQQATWDASYVYCHVEVLDGALAGTYGWVNQKFIRQ